MSRKRYLCIKNFDELQHYKDRNPIWIKLHCSLLDDYEFAQIADESKFHAVGLMLLASRLNNKFPEDERWLRQKINANSEIDLKLLLEIEFLDVVKDGKQSEKKTTIARKSKKTQAESASAISETALEQNTTEENRTENNTTQQTENAAVGDFSKSSKTENESEEVYKNNSSGNGHLSEFTLADCLRYVEHCIGKGDAIKNPQGLAVNLYQTGKSDAFIRAALFPERQKEIEREQFGEPTNFTNEPCRVCFGAKMADAGGKGFRACAHCKNERGKSTGFEPQGENDDENKD